MQKTKNVIFKVVALIILLIVLEVSFTVLIYHLLPGVNMQNAVQAGIDVSLLLTLTFGTRIFNYENNGLIKKSGLDFKLVITFLMLTFVWIYISPAFQYPFFSYIPDFNAIQFSFSKFSALQNGAFFSYYNLFRVILITPILEELLFRKLILQHVSHRYNIYLSVLLTSLLFSISHLDSNNLVIFFIGSIILSILYIKTNNVRYSIAFHIIINLFTVILI